MHPKGISSKTQGRFIDKELLLFDLDGTLIDSTKDLALSVNYMLRTLKRDEFSNDLIDMWVGNGAQILVKRALSGGVTIDENINKAYFEEALSLFLEYYKNNLCHSTIPYENVVSTLEKLQKFRYKMVIITNKPVAFVEPILVALELDSYFDFFIGGDSLAQKKPSPEPLLHVCNELNISPLKSIMIGDSKNDILAAKAANIESIAVSYGHNYGEDIRIYNPNVTVDDFADILGFLKL